MHGSLISLQRQNHGAGRNQNSAYDSGGSRPFTQEYGGEDKHENDAEFVQWRDSGGLAELECAKVAEPGQASTQSRQHQERKGPAADLRESRDRHNGKGDTPSEKENNGSPNRRGQVRIDIGDSQLSQYRGSGSEYGGQ